jgi:hypothetical protein
MPRSPWCYDTATGRFERLVARGEPPLGAGEFPFFVYVPAKKRYWLAGEKGVAVFDADERKWTAVGTKGPLPRGYDLGSCLDPRRNRIYFNAWNGFLAYDIESCEWRELHAAGTPPEVMNDSSTFQCYVYDPIRDVVVVIQFRSQEGKKPERVGVYAYDPGADSWSGPAPLPDAVRRLDVSAANVCFDPELNAFFCFFATDGEDNGVMWAYRWRK